MKKNFLKWLSAFMLVFLLSACNTDKEPAKQDDAKSEEQVEKTESYTVKDDTGADITFEKIPETVISLQPSNTEILFALGVGDKVVGATDFDNYPEEAKEIERVSDSMNINAEKIIALKPDVVIAYTIGEEEALNPLKDAGIPIFVIQSAASFDDVYGDIEQIAQVMGVKEKGEELIHDIRGKIAGVEKKLSSITDKKALYFEIDPTPYTTGKNTFQQEILNAAGVENVFGDQEGWIQVSEEEIIKRNPSIITTTANYLEDPIGDISGRSGWEQLDAVKTEQVFVLDPDITSRPGPRIGEAVELIAKTAYPDLFK